MIRDIKFGREVKALAMRKVIYSILMIISLLIGVIGLFFKGKSFLGSIVLFPTLVFMIFSIYFILKLRNLEQLSYIKLFSDRIEINNIYSKYVIIRFKDINKLSTDNREINIKSNGKNYKVLLQNIDKEQREELQNLLKKKVK